MNSWKCNRVLRVRAPTGRSSPSGSSCRAHATPCTRAGMGEDRAVSLRMVTAFASVQFRQRSKRKRLAEAGRRSEAQPRSRFCSQSGRNRHGASIGAATAREPLAGCPGASGRSTCACRPPARLPLVALLQARVRMADARDVLGGWPLNSIATTASAIEFAGHGADDVHAQDLVGRRRPELHRSVVSPSASRARPLARREGAGLAGAGLRPSVPVRSCPPRRSRGWCR